MRQRIEPVEAEALRKVANELRRFLSLEAQGVTHEMLFQAKPDCKFFRIPVQFLDTTTHYDYGYKGKEWAQRNYIAIHGHPPPKWYIRDAFVPRSRLSDSRNLSPHVLGFECVVLAEVGYDFGLPKKEPTRRCMIAHNPTRTRCRKYTYNKSCVCAEHMKLMKTSNTVAIKVKSAPLAEIIARRTQDPAYRSIREEIGLMRSMLELLVQEFKYEPGVEIDRVHMNAVMQSCRMIGEQVKTLTDIDMRMNSRLSIEQVGNIAEQFAGLVIKLFNPNVEQCRALEAGLGGIINPLRPDGIEGVAELEGEDSDLAQAKFVSASTGVSEIEGGTLLEHEAVSEAVLLEKLERSTRLNGNNRVLRTTVPKYREFLPPGVSRQCDALKHFIPLEDS